MQKEGHMFPSVWAKRWGREELKVVNSKTVTVLHVGGGVPVRAGAGAGQDEGGRGLYVNYLCHLSLLQTLISRPEWEPARLACPKFW